jgi:hypothetical protein
MTCRITFEPMNPAPPGMRRFILDNAETIHGDMSDCVSQFHATLTRPAGTLSHPMGEGRTPSPALAGTLSHPMGEGRGEGA